MKSNVFEVANARDMDSTELASEFIWTTTFDRLFSKRNHIILGARGSGKTALVKMLSFDALVHFDDPRARKIINNKSFIATYLPLKSEFTTKLKPIGDDTNKHDFFFIWSMNLASCSQFISTVRCCLDQYKHSLIEKIKAEAVLAEALGLLWLDEKFSTLHELSSSLSSLEYEKNFTFNKVTFGFDLTEDDLNIGRKFHSDLFSPFKMGIEILKKTLNIGSHTTWAICIDEAEILDENQWILLNTQMRTYSDITFKITTMPYKHKTLKTHIVERLNPKHDFEYIFLDRLGTLDKSQIEADKIIQKFAINLFDKKIANSTLSKSGITLKLLLGKSDLTDNAAEVIPTEKILTYINQYCNIETINRSQTLYDRNPKGKFSDEIERKIRPLLILKDYIESTTGHAYAAPKIYSGYDIAIKCCDGNPRKLINLFNRLIAAAQINDRIGFKPLDKSQQGRIIKSFSGSELDSIKAEENGYEASKLLTSIGNYFKNALHNEKIGAEINMSFRFDINDDEMWEHIRIAVDLGLLIPHLTLAGDNDSMPFKSGRFHLAGCLAPNFYLPPRRGRDLGLSTILKRISVISMRPLDLNLEEQLGLFDEKS